MATKLTSLMTKYDPKCLSEYTTFDLKAKTVIFGYPRGTITRPLLLVRPAGSGKTQLAKLLAAEIIPEMTPYDIHYIDASEDPGVKTIQRLNGMMNTYARNSQDLHVGIIDEAHDLTHQAMTGVKGLLSKYPTLDKGAFFILVTNHLSGVSEPVRDRCQVLNVPATTVDDVLPMAACDTRGYQDLTAKSHAPIITHGTLRLHKREQAARSTVPVASGHTGLMSETDGSPLWGTNSYPQACGRNISAPI